MVNTINPADALPGEVYEGTVDGERLVLFRSDQHASVYMQREAVLALYHSLGEWLMLPQVEPKEEEA